MTHQPHPCDDATVKSVADERQAFEAAMHKHFPQWSFADDGTGGYHAHYTETAWIAWQEATERAARICDGVNNYDNPMTAKDCADTIRSGR